MVTDLLNNLHIAPFLLLFFIGLVFLVLAPVKYRVRTKKLQTTPADITNYNETERRYLMWGAIVALGGLLGFATMINMYGHNYSYTDIQGNKTIINSKDR